MTNGLGDFGGEVFLGGWPPKAPESAPMFESEPLTAQPFVFDQATYDASLDVPEALRGSVKPEAQLARFKGLVNEGVSVEDAMEQLGLAWEDFNNYPLI